MRWQNGTQDSTLHTKVHKGGFLSTTVHCYPCIWGITLAAYVTL